MNQKICDICEKPIKLYPRYTIKQYWFDGFHRFRQKDLDICEDCVDMIKKLRRNNGKK